MSALESWTVAGVPDNPTAWLFRVARNGLWGELRQRARHRRIMEQNTTEVAVASEQDSSAVELGLKTLVRLRAQEKARELRGKITWDGDLDAMRTDR